MKLLNVNKILHGKHLSDACVWRTGLYPNLINILSKNPWYRTPNAKTLILFPSSDFNQELGTLAIDSKYIFFDVWIIIQVRDKCCGSIEDTDGGRPLN